MSNLEWSLPHQDHSLTFSSSIFVYMYIFVSLEIVFAVGCREKSRFLKNVYLFAQTLVTN